MFLGHSVYILLLDLQRVVFLHCLLRNRTARDPRDFVGVFLSSVTSTRERSCEMPRLRELFSRREINVQTIYGSPIFLSDNHNNNIINIFRVNIFRVYINIGRLPPPPVRKIRKAQLLESL